MLNWYIESGKDSDVVLSTRVRIARNIADIPFKVKQTEDDKIHLLNVISEITSSIGYGLKFLKIKDIDDITKISLVEKHIISPEFVKEKYGAILINNEENICIMVNEEDHLRIQVFGAGLSVKETQNLAMEIEEKIGKLVNYAYSDNYGFITSCPTNLGTGMRISVMAQLTALNKTGNIRKMLEIVRNLGMNIRGVYGEGSKASANIYQISNKQTLGIKENELSDNIIQITEQIVKQERVGKKLLAKDEIGFEDNVYRAIGILRNCRKISYEECENLLSEIKLGVDLGIENDLTDLKLKQIQIYTKPANLQKYVGQNLNAYERDIKRAEVIKQILKDNVN